MKKNIKNCHLICSFAHYDNKLDIENGHGNICKS